MSEDLAAYFKECRSLVDAALEKMIPSPDAVPGRLHQAMRYSLMAPGKRIRPALCFAASLASGGGRQEVLPIACALEMIHTFSLIHDDLPAMDDDDLRRGLPTSHKKFDEATAILAGDALATQAFLILGKLKDLYNRNTNRILEIICDIAEATGSTGMVGGQALDMEAEGKKLDADSIRRLHRLKTGRLIAVSVTSGAKLVTDDIKVLSALESYGEAVGLAFQIADDILNVEGGEGMGKSVGSDAKHGKATYPSVLGLDQAREEAASLCKDAISALKNFGPEADSLRAIAKFIVERKN